MKLGSAETAAWSEAYAAPELVQRRQRTYTRKLRRLQLLNPVAGRTLDIACGHGDALQLLARHGHTRLVGVDLSPSDAAVPSSFDRLVADGGCLPFTDGSFERIICLHSLHHFRSFSGIGRLLSECRRLLKRGGHLYLLDPGFYFLKKFLKLHQHTELNLMM